MEVKWMKCCRVLSTGSFYCQSTLKFSSSSSSFQHVHSFKLLKWIRNNNQGRNQLILFFYVHITCCNEKSLFFLLIKWNKMTEMSISYLLLCLCFVFVSLVIKNSFFIGKFLKIFLCSINLWFDCFVGFLVFCD